MKISVLDCTLRDGGYINKWNFKEEVIVQIVNNLSEANIDIIEVGFLRDFPFDRNKSVYNDVTQIKPFIADKLPNIMYVAMIALGDIEADKIAPCDGTSIDGIRLTFHKHEWEEVKELALDLIQKGYKVFVQPVGTTSYSDQELLELIHKVNQLQPYAFYLVDTLGIMYQHDLLRLFYIVDNNLSPSITVGYHSHNNLQLAFSNAQALLRQHTARHIILDASVYGMGRAAGNLCTELIAQYINSNIEAKYDVVPLMEMMDNFIIPIFNDSPWGYSIPYYLAAVSKAHPDYATYLLDKQRVDVRAISAMISQIPSEKRALFDKELVESIYYSFQKNEIDDREYIKKLKDIIDLQRPILMLAPGKTLNSCRSQIQDYIKKHDPLIISVNFIPEDIREEILFISNMKRFGALTDIIEKKVNKIIVTSNITGQAEKDDIFIVNYASLINHDNEGDNAGIMLLRLLMKLGVQEISAAGFDGFSTQVDKDYYNNELANSIARMANFEKNKDIKKQLAQISKKLHIHYVTPSVYQDTTITRRREIE